MKAIQRDLPVATPDDQTIDTDGTDGTGGGSEYEETKKEFFEMLTEMSNAAGATVPATLLDAFATEVASFVECLEDPSAANRRLLRELVQAGVSEEDLRRAGFRLPFKLTVINGGKCG